MPFLPRSRKPIIILVSVIFSIGAFLFFKNNAPQEPVVIYKVTQPAPKQKQAAAGNDATHADHEHPMTLCLIPTFWRLPPTVKGMTGVIAMGLVFRVPRQTRGNQLTDSLRRFPRMQTLKHTHLQIGTKQKIRSYTSNIFGRN